MPAAKPRARRFGPFHWQRACSEHILCSFSRGPTLSKVCPSQAEHVRVRLHDMMAFSIILRSIVYDITDVWVLSPAKSIGKKDHPVKKHGGVSGECNPSKGNQRPLTRRPMTWSAYGAAV
jgi:hypothetical protein